MQVFSGQHWKIFKKTYFEEHLQAAASDIWLATYVQTERCCIVVFNFFRFIESFLIALFF